MPSRLVPTHLLYTSSRAAVSGLSVESPLVVEDLRRFGVSAPTSLCLWRWACWRWPCGGSWPGQGPERAPIRLLPSRVSCCCPGDYRLYPGAPGPELRVGAPRVKVEASLCGSHPAKWQASPPAQTLWAFSSVQSLSRVQLFGTTWTAALRAVLSITNSRTLSKLMSIESVMPSNYLILCCSLPLPPSVFPSIRVFSCSLPMVPASWPPPTLWSRVCCCCAELDLLALWVPRTWTVLGP